MVESLNGNTRTLLEQKIAASTEELRQLHLKPTLDDFQNFWRERLEASLLRLRQELRMLGEDRNPKADPSTAAA